MGAVSHRAHTIPRRTDRLRTGLEADLAGLERGPGPDVPCALQTRQPGGHDDHGDDPGKERQPEHKGPRPQHAEPGHFEGDAARRGRPRACVCRRSRRRVDLRRRSPGSRGSRRLGMVAPLASRNATLDGGCWRWRSRLALAAAENAQAVVLARARRSEAAHARFSVAIPSVHQERRGSSPSPLVAGLAISTPDRESPGCCVAVACFDPLARK